MAILAYHHGAGPMPPGYQVAQTEQQRRLQQQQQPRLMAPTVGAGGAGVFMAPGFDQLRTIQNSRLQTLQQYGGVGTHGGFFQQNLVQQQQQFVAPSMGAGGYSPEEMAFFQRERLHRFQHFQLPQHSATSMDAGGAHGFQQVPLSPPPPTYGPSPP
jgi:hypothetical protein